MESLTSSRTRGLRRRVGRVGRKLVARHRAHRVRQLVDATPRHRVATLTNVARATLVGNVVGVVGDGPAVEKWRGSDHRERRVDGRSTRPFVLDDGTGRISVRVPPDGSVVVGDGFGRGPGRVVVEPGERVTVTGRVVREREWEGSVGDANEPDGEWSLTGPAFALLAPP